MSFIKMGMFAKVSYDQFAKDVRGIFDNMPNCQAFTDDDLRATYEHITCPVRSTTGSAGYDFVSPCEFVLEPGQTVTIPTGIKAFMEPGWFLGLYPRSGLGCKYRLQLDNTVGIIDCDYYNNEKNEGHIIIKVTNDSNIRGNVLKVHIGDRFVQGIFQIFGVTYDDNVDVSRIGGFGSTDG